MLQQALIYRTELLHTQIAVVDVPAPLVRVRKGQGVDDAGEQSIAKADLGQERRAVAVEEAPVVGGRPISTSPPSMARQRSSTTDQ